MSRIGKNPVTIPAGVEVNLNGRDLTVKGTKGELSWTIPQDVTATLGDNVIEFKPAKETGRYAAIWGTSRALVANMVKGVSEGYTIELKLMGVGYRANMQGTKLVLSLGFSHPVEMDVPQGITVTVTETTQIAITGIDKQAVGQFAALIREKRPPEPFKGKGVRYANEYIVMKEGKKK